MALKFDIYVFYIIFGELSGDALLILQRELNFLNWDFVVYGDALTLYMYLNYNQLAFFRRKYSSRLHNMTPPTTTG